jgi:hypothetical protein
MKPTDFIVEHNPFIAQDADEMHRDNEVQMARSDLYASADYAIKLHKILRGINDSADMEQWVMEKIAIANENLRTVYEYLNYESREQEGALPSFQFESAEQQFDSIMEGEDDRKQNALWAEINRHEQAAKKSKDLKQQHHLKMADQLRGQLKTSDNEVTESCDAGATSASAMATGAVGAVAPQRRVKQESAATKKYGNAMKTKAPKIGKGVY